MRGTVTKGASGAAAAWWPPVRVSGRRTPWWIFAAALLPALAVLAFVAVQPLVSADQAFRDVYLATLNTDGTEFPPLLGVVSNVGIVLWCSAAAVALFAGLLLIQAGGAVDARVVYLLSLAAISGLLMADDLFMLHEYVWPALLGVPETVAFLAYGIILAAVIVTFRGLVLATCPALLMLALLAFGVGLAADVAPGFDGPVQRWAEDGPKLVGIALWTAFVLRTAWLLIGDAGRRGPGMPGRD